jgi:ketosteroid isomerase-like protein
VVLPIAASLAGAAAAADFDPAAAHADFIDAFNGRDWAAVKAQLADDAVFQRTNASEVQSGPEAIVAHFEQPIGGEWNVKFARLDSKHQLAGKDGRVVERGDFAITAGADDSACYAGSYLATWAPARAAWWLQMLTWQDLETDQGGENVQQTDPHIRCGAAFCAGIDRCIKRSSRPDY